MLEHFFSLFWGGSFTTASIALAWVKLCHGAVWKKGTRRRILMEFIALYFVLKLAFVVPIIVFRWFNTVLWISLHALVSVLYVYFFADCQKQTRLFLWCSMYAGICCLSTIGGQFQFLIPRFTENWILGNIVSDLCYLLMIPLALYLRHFNFGKFGAVPRIGYFLVLTGDVSIFVLTAVELPWMKTDYRIVITLLAGVLCVFVIVLVSVFAIYTMCKEQSAIITLQAERHRLLGERELVRVTQINLEDLRCIRHDLKNQYAYMRLLLQGKKYEELEDYFEKMAEDIPVPPAYIDCGNQVIDNILSMELAKAKHAGIKVEHQVIVPPELPFADDDLCSLLVNLMDNAIEECKRLRENGTEDVQLQINIHPHGSYLYIVCRNSTDKETLSYANNALKTTKGDSTLHGYGTRIVEKLAQRHNGNVAYSLKDGKFVAKVIMDMMLEEKL